MLQAVLFWSCERDRNPEISNPLEALWAIAVFVFSGADFTPVTAWGRFLALVGIVEGMTLVSVLIASLTVLQLRGRKGGTMRSDFRRETPFSWSLRKSPLLPLRRHNPCATNCTFPGPVKWTRKS